MPDLRLLGAREHNLQGVDLQLPRGCWIAVTGPSGSGKTTLVFDTIVAEGQRRYLGSLSARARQYFSKLADPDLDVLDGLPTPIAVRASTRTSNPRSTVGTLTGLLDLFRLLFAREARAPDAAPLTRSHFSFNHPSGACPQCNGLGVRDEVDPARLVADAEKSIRDGALRPTLPNGYTVYSQVTLEVMDQICRAHGFDVDTPWRDLDDPQREVIFYGTKALEVPFGKHSIESRMKWEGITARPREVGYYRGIVRVIEETLARNRNPNILRYVSTVPCPACEGSRLAEPGRLATLHGHTLPALMGTPVGPLRGVLDELPSSNVWDAISASVLGRLDRMQRLGLAHLSPARQSSSLSDGESQRLRLVSQLAGGLCGQLVALDEPTLGLHPETQPGLAAVLEEMRAAGNTLVLVEHDPDMVRCADHVVRLGPGAGPDGGRVVSQGAAPEFPLGKQPSPRSDPKLGDAWIHLIGARLHNLRSCDLRLAIAGLNVVAGPSGAGKSSLVFGTLLPALEGEPGGPFDRLDGAAPGAVTALDARPIGRTPRSTPATWSGMFDRVRKLFAATAAAKAQGLKASHFSYNAKSGRCETCEGLGRLKIGLHLLSDAEVQCPQCGGKRYRDEILQIRLAGRSIADVLALCVDEAVDAFSDDPAIHRLARAMQDLGLGYLRLGQPSNSLSLGEAQRIRLATLLGTTSASPSVLLLDEPDRGLEPTDVARLVRALRGLCERGHTVVAISHHRHLWAAADHFTEVREGGTTNGATPDLSERPPPRGRHSPAVEPASIALRGGRTHNLANVDVDLKRGALTAIVGVSGSGKTSLAFDTVAAEAFHRFAETLPFTVRRFIRNQPRPEFDSLEGLSPTLMLRQSQARATSRSTVATQAELSGPLRLLWSRLGVSDTSPSSWSAEHFSPDRPLGACAACEGRGVQSRCSPERLITAPEKSIEDGALEGTRVGQFLAEPDGQHIATLRAAAPNIDLGTPWSELAEEDQQTILFGTGPKVVNVHWQMRRGKRTGEHSFEATWDGFCALALREARRRANAKRAAAWAAPLVDEPCSECGGTRLRAPIRDVRISAETLPSLLARPLAEAVDALERLEVAAGLAPILDRLRKPILARLRLLKSLGLGYLALNRGSPTLSDGELARVRLASVLESGLTGVTVVLDEPSVGLHARDVDRMLERLRGLRDGGNTVLVVTHRPAVIRGADAIVELGPGAGPDGGRVVAQGSPAEVLAGSTPTANALRSIPSGGSSSADESSIEFRGAAARNLQGFDVHLPSTGFVAITGVSGAGKSTLAFDVIAASAEAQAPRGCRRIYGLPHFASVVRSRDATQGKTVLTSMGLMPALQRLFAPMAKEVGLSRSAFSFESPAGRCQTCSGSGEETIALDFLADLARPCPTCDGRRYRDEVLRVRWEGRDVAELLSTPVSSLASDLGDGALRDGLTALVDVGLGYLALGRRRGELSGGEQSRLAIARCLRTKSTPTLLVLDEPARGLHESDVSRLRSVLGRVAQQGNLIVATEHRCSLVAAADWVIDLGPEAGPQGGRLVASGAPHSLRRGATAHALQRYHAAASA